jgi:hypothetical protein
VAIVLYILNYFKNSMPYGILAAASVAYYSLAKRVLMIFLLIYFFKRYMHEIILPQNSDVGYFQSADMLLFAIMIGIVFPGTLKVIGMWASSRAQKKATVYLKSLKKSDFIGHSNLMRSMPLQRWVLQAPVVYYVTYWIYPQAPIALMFTEITFYSVYYLSVKIFSKDPRRTVAIMYTREIGFAVYLFYFSIVFFLYRQEIPIEYLFLIIMLPRIYFNMSRQVINYLENKAEDPEE